MPMHVCRLNYSSAKIPSRTTQYTTYRKALQFTITYSLITYTSPKDRHAQCVCVRVCVSVCCVHGNKHPHFYWLQIVRSICWTGAINRGTSRWCKRNQERLSDPRF